MDLSTERGHALDAAVDVATGLELNHSDILPLATKFYGWLVGPASMSLSFGPIVEQGTEEPTGRNGSAMTQLRDSQKFTVSLTAQDAKGAEVLDDASTTADDATWTSSNEEVATVEVDADNPRSATVIAGMPGSATLTVAIGEISATLAVDVVPGDIALVSITEGPIEEQ